MDLEKDYEKCLKSVKSYKKNAYLIHNKIKNGQEKIIIDYLTKKSEKIQIEDFSEKKKYVSLFFIRDLILKKDKKLINFLYEKKFMYCLSKILYLLCNNKKIENCQKILNDENLNKKYFEIILLIFYETNLILVKGDNLFFDKIWKKLENKKIPFFLIEESEDLMVKFYEEIYDNDDSFKNLENIIENENSEISENLENLEKGKNLKKNNFQNYLKKKNFENLKNSKNLENFENNNYIEESSEISGFDITES